MYRLFKRLWPTAQPFKRVQIWLGIVIAILVVGIIAYQFTRAANPTVTVEAEALALTNGATTIDDGNASGGKAIKFAAPGGASNTTPSVNPNASAEVRKVLNYLHTIEGNGILAGQHERDDCTNCESERMKSITGKLPAIHGHDVADYAADPMQEAINDWNVRRQIPTITWHVSAPGLPEGWENVNVSADVNAAVTPGTSQNTSLMAKLDKLAGRLQTLENANVPVLWRPWHEMDGGWFWWSASGSEAYKKLWILTYNYFTTTKGLNNLIWVWSDSEKDPPNASWFPGSQYVDIMGSDTYDSRTTIDNLKTHYSTHKSIAATKPVAHTETDIILDPDQLKSQQINLIWFLPWYGQWVNENGDSNLTRIYNHSYVITADEMPSLK